MCNHSFLYFKRAIPFEIALTIVKQKLAEPLIKSSFHK